MNTSDLALFALVFAATSIALLITRARLRRRSMDSPSASERYRELSGRCEGGVTADVGEAVVELDRVAREIHNRIDTQLCRLESLIREADERIAKLEPQGPAPDGEPQIRRGLSREPVDRRRAKVYALSDDGLDSREISRRTELSRSEVDLYLALRGSGHPKVPAASAT